MKTKIIITILTLILLSFLAKVGQPVIDNQVAHVSAKQLNSSSEDYAEFKTAQYGGKYYHMVLTFSGIVFLSFLWGVIGKSKTDSDSDSE